MCHSQIKSALETLTGRKCSDSHFFDRLNLNCDQLDLGFSQFNEILLLLGFDRVERNFFSFLCDNQKHTILNIEHLNEGVERFVKLSLLLFGNITDAFNSLSRDDAELQRWLDILRPIDSTVFSKRHHPILSIEKIRADKTYFLGYIVHSQIKARLEANPRDSQALEEQRMRSEIVEQGKRNQEAYLASDHMDVYVATSMREKHEYLIVSRITDQIFEHEMLRDLRLRYFDPTQAYCEDRIDKGISEGLMLKRAACTIYLAQESDTLGKDSELAATLAQGKPVIAFIPEGTAEYVHSLVEDLQTLEPAKAKRQIILDQLRIFNPKLAWDEPQILVTDEGTLLEKLKATVKDYYNKRARVLSETHPLGLQVNLSTGVANGVLVVRTTEDCAKLLRNILTQNLEFVLDKKVVGGATYWLLREKITNCVYRAITSNRSLTNSFWNFYLQH